MVWIDSLHSLYMNELIWWCRECGMDRLFLRVIGQPCWHCEGAITFSVRSRTSPVISYKTAIIGNYMSWSGYKRHTMTLKKSLIALLPGLLGLQNEHAETLRVHDKWTSIKSRQSLFTEVIYDGKLITINYFFIQKPSNLFLWGIKNKRRECSVWPLYISLLSKRSPPEYLDYIQNH